MRWIRQHWRPLLLGATGLAALQLGLHLLADHGLHHQMQAKWNEVAKLAETGAQGIEHLASASEEAKKTQAAMDEARGKLEERVATLEGAVATYRNDVLQLQRQVAGAP